MAHSKRKVANVGPASKPKRGRGRPAVHGEAWTKVTVVLFNRQIIALHRLSAEIKTRTGRMLNRTQMIRALIDGMLRSRIDVTTSGTEADLARRVTKQLSG